MFKLQLKYLMFKDLQLQNILKNIFEDGELDKKQVCSKMEHTASNGKTYNTEFYNLDAII